MTPPFSALAERRGYPPATQYYVLGLLFLISLLSFADRLILGVLQVPIKAELGLSDAQIGALTGLAFFIPYTILSIPMSAWADRANRKLIMVGALLLWSAMTAGIGLANSFLVIFILRMGVAIGEACCMPTAFSLITDYFWPRHRARALAVFNTSFPVGTFVGLTGAGMIAAALGWRAAFFIVGGAGLILAPIVLLTMREPVRGGTSDTPDAPPPPFLQSLRILWNLRAFRYICIAQSCQTFTIVTLLVWTASFYVRFHQADLAQTALLVGAFSGIAGALGTLAGGIVGDRMGMRDPRWYLRIPAITTALTVPAVLVQFLTGSFAVSAVAGMIAVFFSNMHTPSVYAVSHRMVSPRMCALASGVIISAGGLTGASLAPVITGELSDWLQAAGHDSGHALRIAICSAVIFSIIASLTFLASARMIPRHLWGGGETRGEAAHPATA